MSTERNTKRYNNLKRLLAIYCANEKIMFVQRCCKFLTPLNQSAFQPFNAPAKCECLSGDDAHVKAQNEPKQTSLVEVPYPGKRQGRFFSPTMPFVL